jgi:hypothetical protein
MKKKKKRFYRMALSKFQESLESNPNNKEILLNVALTWTLALEDEFSEEISKGKPFPKEHIGVISATEYYLRFFKNSKKIYI